METPHAHSFPPARVGVNKKCRCTAVVVAPAGSLTGGGCQRMGRAHGTLPSARKIKTVIP